MRKLTVIGISMLVIGALTAVYFAVLNPSAPDAANAPVSILPDGKASSTPVTKPTTITKGGYNGQAMSYLASPTVLSRLPQAVVTTGQKRLESAIQLIGKYPKDPDNWIELGLAKKTFENYTGARDAWEFAKALNPEKPLAYYNLGNIYSAYLKDNMSAEKNYLKALDLDSHSDYPYIGLAEFYRDFYKAKFDMVDDVLLAGLKVMPRQSSLILMLAVYYRDTGKDLDAADYFERYLVATPDLDGAHYQMIQEEIAKLRFK